MAHANLGRVTINRSTGITLTSVLIISFVLCFVALAVWVNFFFIADHESVVAVSPASEQRSDLDQQPAGLMGFARGDAPGQTVSRATTPSRATGDRPSDAADTASHAQAATGPLVQDQDEEPDIGSSALSMLASFFGAADEPRHAGADRTGSAADEQRAEWVDDLYVQLNSLEPPAVGAANTTPVISGRVLTRSGRPVSGVGVSAQLRQYFNTGDSNARSQEKTEQRTTTNSDGFYAFRDLPEGIYLIGTQASGSYAPARIEVRTGVKYADLVLESQRTMQVKGIVTDTMGMELGAVRIMPLVKGIPRGAVSDANGGFEFAVALQGETRSFPVRFQLEGYREQRYQVSDADWAEDGSLALAVAMEPVYEFSTVSGSLKDTAGVQVAGETVRLYSPSLKRNYRAVSDAGGEFLFSEVEVVDDYQLWIRPTGPYRDFTEQNLALSHGSLRRDITLASLNRGYRLSGRILDQDGKPVPDFTLALRSKAASGQTVPVISNEYGEFVVENAPEGDLVFESRTMPYYTLSGVRLSGDEKEHHVDLVVSRGQHKLLGKVISTDGNPVATPKVFITSTQVIDGIRSQASSSTAADANGRFLFTDLGAGQHTVTVNAPGYEGVRLKPVVGMQHELVVRLEKNSI